MRATSAAPLFASFALMVAATADAATFTVKPTSVSLSSRTTSTLVTVTNTSNRQLRFEVRAMKWVQDDRGELKLTPVAKEITFVPALLTLAPGASRNVRVGAAPSAFGAVEGTYRLFVEELEDKAAPPGPGTVAIRLEIGVPIFLTPARPASSAQITGVAFEQGRLVTRVRNTGNVHMIVNAVKLQGTDGAGAVKYDRSLEGWYVLAGDTRIFEQPIAPADCAGARTMAVTVDIQGTTLKSEAPVPAGACSSPPAR
jgi:P pilus assembly chaperone PapD